MLQCPLAASASQPSEQLLEAGVGLRAPVAANRVSEKLSDLLGHRVSALLKHLLNPQYSCYPAMPYDL